MQQAGVRRGIVSSILTVWAAMGVFGAVTSAVNHAWGVEKQPSYLKHKLMRSSCWSPRVSCCSSGCCS